MSAFAQRLTAAGMSAHEAAAKAELFDRCAATLADAGVAAGQPFAFFVPGRIEVLGKHTDYAGGRSLLCAMERGFTVLAAPRDDARVRVLDALGGTTVEFAIDPELVPVRGEWSNYVATVVRSMARNFPAARRGADIAFASDLPAASGMSSSSAMVIAMFLALSAANALEHDAVYQRIITSNELLAEYLGAVENGRSFGPLEGDVGVGTMGGSQDQTAILCCRAGVLSRYSFCPVRAEGEIPFPSTLTFVVAFSGVAASKTSNALHQYNEASQAVSAIVGAWNAATRRHDLCLADAVGSSATATAELRDVLRATSLADFTPQRLTDRFEQFVAESYDIIPQASAALAQNDMHTLGALVRRSQLGVEQLLGNQVAETIALAELAREHGAHAASAFGAGFGGSVWALADASSATEFLDAWRDAYRLRFPTAASHSEFYITAPGPGAIRLG